MLPQASPGESVFFRHESSQPPSPPTPTGICSFLPQGRFPLSGERYSRKVSPSPWSASSAPLRLWFCLPSSGSFLSSAGGQPLWMIHAYHPPLLTVLKLHFPFFSAPDVCFVPPPPFFFPLFPQNVRSFFSLRLRELFSFFFPEVLFFSAAHPPFFAPTPPS